MLASRYDHDPNHWRFPRHHSGNPPDPEPALEPLWKDIAAGIGIIVFMVAAFWLCGSLPR